MRRTALLAAALVGLVAAGGVPVVVAAGGPAGGPAGGRTGGPAGGAAQALSGEQWVALYEPGVSDAAGRAAVQEAGGQVVRSSPEVGYAVVRSARPDFGLRAAATGALVGASPDRRIGRAPGGPVRGGALSAPASSTPGSPGAGTRSVTGGDPLSGRQWDMARIGATPTGSYAVQRGSAKVLVGIMDTGIDATHPDLAPVLDRAHSRTFVRDLPDVDNGVDRDGDGDGDDPCEARGCVDPVGVDDNGHGTHVASTVAAPLNGIGISGVAPGVRLVDLRVGQDSGLYFLQPTLDALAYAARTGVDVVVMSFYVDPWLFNCTTNPLDSAEERTEQRTVREAVQRAVTQARSRGVLPVAAAGNEGVDLDRPSEDATSPDYGGAVRFRRISDACITVPAETAGVVAVTATGPTGQLAYYSDYGLSQADVAAPGGDSGVAPGGARAEVLGALPETLARSSGALDREGRPTSPDVVRDCVAGRCAYYRYSQGTSAAAPHAAGVAALLVSRYGRTDTDSGHVPGLTLDPARTEQLLRDTATPTRCPASDPWSRRCEGTTAHNGFFGDGVVSARRAVS